MERSNFELNHLSNIRNHTTNFVYSHLFFWEVCTKSFLKKLLFFYDEVVFGAVSTPGELTLPLLLKTAGFFLKMFFKSNSTLGRTRGLSGLGLGNPAKNRLYCSTTRSESSALSISMSLLGAKTLSETQVIQTYISWYFLTV